MGVLPEVGEKLFLITNDYKPELPEGTVVEYLGLDRDDLRTWFVVQTLKDGIRRLRPECLGRSSTNLAG
jgi:hypothetical protein